MPEIAAARPIVPRWPAPTRVSQRDRSREFEWKRGDVLPLALHHCSECYGSGFSFGRKLGPCNCVLRAIFRICLDRFARCCAQQRQFSPARLRRSGTWGRRDEEYIADFLLVARRNLDESEHRLFRLYFIEGVDWKVCAQELGLSRGNVFHAAYRIEAKLGRVFRELEPYSLFPLAEYFHGPRKTLDRTNGTR